MGVAAGTGRLGLAVLTPPWAPSLGHGRTGIISGLGLPVRAINRNNSRAVRCSTQILPFLMLSNVKTKLHDHVALCPAGGLTLDLP